MKRAASDSGAASSSGGASGSQQHKRRRRSAFTQHSYPVVRGGGGDRPLVLLRLPEEVELAPPGVASYLYPEEVVIEEDDEEEQAAQAKGHRRARPSVQWVLESESGSAARLTGVKRPLGDEMEQHCRYFVMMINDNEPDAASSEGGGGGICGKGKGRRKKQCELLPLEDVIVVRHAHTGEGGLSEEVKDFIAHGRRVDLQARDWQAKYGTAGKALVAAWDACAMEDEVGNGRARGPRLLQQQQGSEGPEQGPRRWVRTFRVDEDADAGEDSFNPSTKVAPGYQDILGDVGDDSVEAVAGVFNETDLGMDEVPDGADDGFGAPEFGEEDHVRVRDGQQQMLLLEENAPSIDPILREMEGLRDEDSEDDAGMYSSSDEEGKGEAEQGAVAASRVAGGVLFAAPSRPAGTGAAAGAGAGAGAILGGVVFAEGFAALERAGQGSDTHSDYDGDDDESEDEG